MKNSNRKASSLRKSNFELLAPINGNGMIADFIEKRGEGLHHVAFAVENLENGMKILKEKGLKFVTDQPMELHGETTDISGKKISGTGKFSFSRPSSFLGILFEFIQYPKEMNESWHYHPRYGKEGGRKDR